MIKFANETENKKEAKRTTKQKYKENKSLRFVLQLKVCEAEHRSQIEQNRKDRTQGATERTGDAMKEIKTTNSTVCSTF